MIWPRQWTQQNQIELFGFFLWYASGMVGRLCATDFGWQSSAYQNVEDQKWNWRIIFRENLYLKRNDIFADVHTSDIKNKNGIQNYKIKKSLIMSFTKKVILYWVNIFSMNPSGLRVLFQRRTSCHRSTTVTIWLTCLQPFLYSYDLINFWWDSHYNLARPNDYYELFAQSSRSRAILVITIYQKGLVYCPTRQHGEILKLQWFSSSKSIVKSVNFHSRLSPCMFLASNSERIVLWVWDWVSYKSPLLKFRGHKRTAPVSEMLLAFWFMNFKMNYLN